MCFIIIWTNPFNDLFSFTNGMNVVSTASTGFRTNKTLWSIHFSVVVVELIVNEEK